MEADKARLVTALLACQSRADLEQLRGMDSPSIPFITLACKHNRADLLHFLLEDETSYLSDAAVVADPRWCSVEQEYEGHDAAYYAIRSNNVELLRILLETVTPELSERLFSESYEEVLLNNIFVTEEMHLFIQYKLHDLRFFSKGDEALPASSTANIQERIQMLMENITQINTYKDVDSHFLYTARFIGQNIHILKQQLKSTYDRLPWEEIEFCLVSFVSAHIRRQELNFFYLTVLKKERILKELNTFASDLQELVVHIGSTDVQTLRKPVKLINNRDDVVAAISRSYPDLYADYKEVRDISSLHIMKTYLDAALLADPATRVGQLTIKRALQVTGEHLKNTLDSPKLSPAVSELLFLSVHKETRKVLRDLRNSLSHPHLESEDFSLYSNIQNDIKNIASVIIEITYFNKVNKIKRILTRLMNSDSVEEFQENTNIFRDFYLADVEETDTITKYQRNILDIIKGIPDQTPNEKELFVEIKDVIDKKKHGFTINDYFHLQSISLDFFICLNRSTKIVSNLMIGTKHRAKIVLENFPSQNNPLEIQKASLLCTLLSTFYDSVSARISPEVAFGIEFAIARIGFTGSIDNSNIKCIDDYSRQLLLESKEEKKCYIKRIKNDSEIIGKQLSLKLSELGNTIRMDIKYGQIYENLSLLYKYETVNRFTVEVLILDIMSLLDSSKLVPNNILYLDGHLPLLNGKCLRNHLAHGNTFVDILPTDAWSAVFLNAVKLYETKDDLLNHKFGNVLKHDITQLRRRYERGLSYLDKQKDMWKSLLDGNFENFALKIAEGADIYSRTKDLSSTLHHAARGPNIEIIKFLTKREMMSTEVIDVNGQTALHVAAAFGRDVTVEFLVAEMEKSINQADNYGRTPLHLASQNGHKKTVMTLLSLGAKTALKDVCEYSPLHYAVRNNYLDVVKILLKKEATVDENTIYGGFTALHTAAENGYLEIVHYLILNQADVNARNDEGTYPLQLAAFFGHKEIVDILLEKGAFVNLRNSFGSALHYAVENKHEEIVKILLRKGAFVDIADKVHNNTPLHTAIHQGYSFIVDLLLKNGANSNASRFDGLTPLSNAAQGGHADIAVLLLQYGALAESRDVEGYTALDYAAMHGHATFVETLIQKGIDIHYQNFVKNQVTPLHLAAKAGYQQVVDILLAAGANVRFASDEGITALHLSAADGHEAISEALIKKGANVNCKDNYKRTPLHAAAYKACNKKTIQILIKYGSDANAKTTSCRTALHVASFVGNSSVVEALLQGKANVDAEDSDGVTAMHLAASGNHMATVEILLKYGADINHLDSEGSSALCWAARKNNKDLLDLLLTKGADVNVGEGKLLFTSIKTGHRLVVEALMKNKKINTNVKRQDGLNLLYAAAESGDERIARALIEKGIKVRDCLQNPSPLIIAINYGHIAFVEVLLENGADINPTNPNLSPLFGVVQVNKPDILERLLHWGANPNIRESKTNTSPLELAVQYAQISNISLLLREAGDKINEKGNDNWTLLHFAAQAGSLEVTRLLIDRGADVNARNIKGSKPIHVAARHGHLSILTFFLELGMSLDDLGHDGRNLMHFAAEGGQLAVAQYLMDKHVDINSSTLDGFKPIHYSAIIGHTEMVKLLLCGGAVYNVTTNLGMTPSDLTKSFDIKEVLESIEKLFKAVKQNNVLMVGILTKYMEKYLNVKTSHNTTLLHIASWKGFQEICDVLLKSNANPNAVGKGGNAPLHYASKFSHPGIVESLLKNGAIHNLKSGNSRTALDFATHQHIKNLLEKVSLCFLKVRAHDVTVIKEINTMRNVEIIKAVMKARDTEGNTLVVVAMKNSFPNTDELKQVSQANVTRDLIMVNNLLAHERFPEALDILKQLLNKRIDILGEDNPGTLDIQSEIAYALYKQSKYFETMPMLENIYRKRVEAFGCYHQDTLDTRSFLALLLCKLGRNKEAWDIFQEVIPRLQEALGERHEKLMDAKNSAGLVLRSLGKFEEALHFHTQLYETYKNTFGSLYPSTLIQQNNIATVLLSQDKHDEAFAMFQSVYEARKNILVPNHSDTLRARRNMAIALTKQHKYDEALQICQEILPIQKNVLGLHHLDTVESQSLMTDLYAIQNNFHDALKVHKAQLDARITVLGPNNPNYTTTDRFMDNIDKFNKTYIGCVAPCDFNMLIAASKNNRCEVRRLIENGSDVNTVDGEGRTALHFASTVEVVEELLDNGADPTALSQKGNTPLHLAASRACEKTVLLLLQKANKTKRITYHKFINVKTVVGGSTALHVAAKKGATDIVRCLLEHGVCYNSRDRSDNRTPLQCSSSPSVIRLLRLAEEVFKMAERGGIVLPQGDGRNLVAVLNSRDTDNRTPMQLAEFHGHTATARLLDGPLETLD